MNIEVFKYSQVFKLESGKTLRGLEIGFHTYGRLNKNRDNVVWVCHALTANSDVFDWWKGLFGKGHFFNPDEHFVVCANVLGSAYGTTNPLSVNPVTGQPYYLSFPEVTIRDMIKAHQLLADHLGINEIDVLIGGSLGGQQALEWGILEPERIKTLSSSPPMRGIHHGALPLMNLSVWLLLLIAAFMLINPMVAVKGSRPHEAWRSYPTVVIKHTP